MSSAAGTEPGSAAGAETNPMAGILPHIPIPRAHLGGYEDVNTYNDAPFEVRTVPRAHCGGAVHTNVVNPTAVNNNAVNNNVVNNNVVDASPKLAIISRKRKTLEDNIELVTSAITNTVEQLRDIKKHYKAIAKLEKSLESSKKRLKKESRSIINKMSSYSNMASRYMEDKKKCIKELKQLDNHEQELDLMNAVNIIIVSEKIAEAEELGL